MLNRRLSAEFDNARAYAALLDTSDALMQQAARRSKYVQSLAASKDLTALDSVRTEVSRHREKALSVFLNVSRQRKFDMFTVSLARFKVGFEVENHERTLDLTDDDTHLPRRTP